MLVALPTSGANAQLGNRFTEPASDSRYLPQSDIVIGYGQQFLADTGSSPTTSSLLTDAFRASGGNGTIQPSLHGPERFAGLEYGLKWVSYCKRPEPVDEPNG